jgi:hypothetical protein
MTNGPVVQYRHVVETIDRLLCDICSLDHPFSGITVVLGGDF